MNKRVVAILFGGVSSEHEVSRMSATSVLKNIDREAFDPVMVGITKDGRWLRYTGPVEQIVTGEWEQHPDNRPCILSPDRSVHGLVLFGDQGAETVRLDAVFPVMHGRNAEDGSMQGLCELSGVPYVGPGVTASALCMDKEYTHIVLAASGVPTTDWVCVHRDAVPSLLDLEVKIAVKLGGFPVFVKPCNAGSSVGVSKVQSSDELEAAMALAFENDDKLLIERTLIGNDTPEASTHAGEIVPPDGLYDYSSKYLDDTAGLYLPARISDEATELLRSTAVKAYRALGCQGLSRVDFFLQEDGSCVLNEINTLPGFTNISMYPKLMMDAGLSYPALITRLIDLAMSR